jgi:hypothetical protein
MVNVNSLLSTHTRYLFTNRTHQVVISLAALVAVAAVATSGVMLAGYLPQWTGSMAATTLAIDVMLLSAFLAIRFFRSAAPKASGTVSSVLTQEKDLLAIIFGYLDVDSLARARLVNNLWKNVIDNPHNNLWSPFVHASDWREESPCYHRALFSTRLVGRALYKIYERGKKPCVALAYSGNHVVFLGGELRPRLVVLQLGSKEKDGQLMLRASKELASHPKPTGLSYRNEIVYVGFEDGSMLLWDLKSDQTDVWDQIEPGVSVSWVLASEDTIITGNGQQGYKIYKREDRTLLHQGLNSTRCHLIHESFFYTETVECDLKTGYARPPLWRGDSSKIKVMSAFRENIICGLNSGEVKCWNLKTWRQETLFSHNTSITKMQVSQQTLFAFSAAEHILTIYDLDQKKKLNKLDTGRDFDFANEIGGIILTLSHDSMKIYDYRSN